MRVKASTCLDNQHPSWNDRKYVHAYLFKLRLRRTCLWHGSVAAEAEKLGVPLLAEIPLSLDIRVASDGGVPIVVSQPESAQAKPFTKRRRH